MATLRLEAWRSDESLASEKIAKWPSNVSYSSLKSLLDNNNPPLLDNNHLYQLFSNNNHDQFRRRKWVVDRRDPLIRVQSATKYLCLTDRVIGCLFRAMILHRGMMVSQWRALVIGWTFERCAIIRPLLDHNVSVSVNSMIFPWCAAHNFPGENWIHFWRNGFVAVPQWITLHHNRERRR